MVNMRTMVGIDLVKSLVNFFFKIFDGYITGSLAPTGSQIRKKEILNKFFILRLAIEIKILHMGYKIRRRNPVSEFL